MLLVVVLLPHSGAIRRTQHAHETRGAIDVPWQRTVKRMQRRWRRLCGDEVRARCCSQANERERERGSDSDSDTCEVQQNAPASAPWHPAPTAPRRPRRARHTAGNNSPVALRQVRGSEGGSEAARYFAGGERSAGYLWRSQRFPALLLSNALHLSVVVAALSFVPSPLLCSARSSTTLARQRRASRLAVAMRRRLCHT